LTFPRHRYIHLEQNLKKQQMDEERYSQIERENYLLLDKMSHIMTHPQLLDEKYMGAPVTFGKSLNKEFREFLTTPACSEMQQRSATSNSRRLSNPRAESPPGLQHSRELANNTALLRPICQKP
jgi:hypothetical protein